MLAMLSLRFGALLLLAVYASGASTTLDEAKNLEFPPNFLLGTATAAYQIEGAWNVSGKGESTWDRYTHKQNNRIYHGDTGDIAADSYDKYIEDIAIMKRLGNIIRYMGEHFPTDDSTRHETARVIQPEHGVPVDIRFAHRFANQLQQTYTIRTVQQFNSYRFSVSWPRLLPTGFPNYINRDAVRYYNNVIDELLRYDIVPMLTLYHWDHPQAMEEMGGWLNSEFVDWFGDYARIVFQEFGAKVKKFIPINEPISICKEGYSKGYHAPGKKLHGFGEYLCMHNVIKAHARAYRIYEEEFKPMHNGEVGVQANPFAYMPRSAADKEAAEVAFQFNVGWTLHPIYSELGDYPSIMKSTVAKKSEEQGYRKSRLPTFDAEWIKYIKGSSDFLAVNHYTTRLVTYGFQGVVPSQENDQGVIEIIDKMWRPSVSSWLWVVPEGFRFVLNQLKTNYGNPPMYITENGVSDFGTLDDDDRIYYYREYLRQMLLAIHVDGVNVKGYMLWSLLDNFEWHQGYHEHFGIVYVDYNHVDRSRIYKKSAFWWKNIIAANRIDGI